jgi:hypothetical protein
VASDSDSTGGTGGADERPTAEVDGQPATTGDLRNESEPAGPDASEQATEEAEALGQPRGSGGGA